MVRMHTTILLFFSFYLISVQTTHKNEHPQDFEDDTSVLLHNYFALSHSLTTLYAQWSLSDANFARREEAFHDFPGPEALAGEGVEAHLRQLGFGYRAKYIAETAGSAEEDILVKKEEGAEEKESVESKADLDNPPTYQKAHEALLTLPGVGPKVSDCVCLMGLGWGESVPIDTHVWQIAQRDYNFGDHFRKIWGPQAGWAQSVLFTANLKSFSEQAAGVEKKGVVKMEEEARKEDDMAATTSVAMSRKRKTVAAEVIPKAEPDATVQTDNNPDVTIQ
ncbi:DNA glycosylase [Neurospora crassa]|nr:DNA glycosylase [Neurospora crassa]